MTTDGWQTQADDAIRALEAVVALLAGPADQGGQGPQCAPVDRVLVALEAARTAQVHAANVVRLLTERALREGASFPLLGFAFDDPHE